VSSLTLIGGVPLRGRITVPGCKGISHRALVFAAIADGTSRIRGLAPGADVAATRAVLGALGVRIEPDEDGIAVHGAGVDGLRAARAALECANSGTTMRLLAGLLAGRPFRSVLDGDASLRTRPMGRVVEPLRALGATITGAVDAAGQTASDTVRAPLTVVGGPLTGARVRLDVASGQVKTALVLAGLQASGTTEIVEPAPSRDHTERLLRALGVPLDVPDPTTVRVRAAPVPAYDLTVPGDPSSAAFFAVAAAIVPGSAIVVERVALNPGRTAYLDVLRAMGARVTATTTGEELGEPVGDVEIEAGTLRGTEIRSREAIVDELPVLAVAGAFADGLTEIRDAAELAVKESDRIATVREEVRRLGVAVERRADGLAVRGGAPRPASFESHGDHRIAMAAAVAAAAAPGESTVRGWEAVAVSYPGFAADLARLRGEP
jgi:3-phosphoshikimate 1-carboxyvinyltransferase